MRFVCSISSSDFWLKTVVFKRPVIRYVESETIRKVRIQNISAIRVEIDSLKSLGLSLLNI